MDSASTKLDDVSIQDRLQAVRLIAMDVDGVLTDGTIELIGEEDETKKFHIADGLGIRLALNAGLIVAWITGRAGSAVKRRAAELSVNHLYQDTSNKSAAIAELIGSYSLTQSNIAYIGDDLNDLPAYSLAGVRFATANAVAEIKALADFVTERKGGEGAVREAIDVVLKAQGKWNDAVTGYLAGLIQSQS